MSSPASSVPASRGRAVWTIVTAALVIATLDISYAFLYWGLRGATPGRVLQGVAAALLGKSSFQRGLSTVAMGLAMHLFVAFTVTTIFYLCSRLIPLMRRRPILAGAIYGSGVYVVMYYVVLPLTNATLRYTPATIALNLAVHIVLIGIPISLIVWRRDDRALQQVPA